MFSACADALLELPAVGGRVAALDPRELGLRLFELPLRGGGVDLVGRHRIVDERDRAILEHLEEARAGRELLDLPVAGVHARRARLQQRDERRVPCEHADLAGRAGDDQHLGVAVERGALRRHDRDREERMVGHDLGRGAGGLAFGGFVALLLGLRLRRSLRLLAPIVFARSTACSITPTM